MKTHWLGSYIVKEITDGGEVILQKFDETPIKGLVNDNRPNPYQDSGKLAELKKNKRENPLENFTLIA